MSKHKALVMVSSVGKCNGSEGSHVCGNASRGEGTGLEAPKQDSRSSSMSSSMSCFLVLKNTYIYAYSAYVIDRIVLRVTAEMFMGESVL